MHRLPFCSTKDPQHGRQQRNSDIEEPEQQLQENLNKHSSRKIPNIIYSSRHNLMKAGLKREVLTFTSTVIFQIKLHTSFQIALHIANCQILSNPIWYKILNPIRWLANIIEQLPSINIWH